MTSSFGRNRSDNPTSPPPAEPPMTAGGTAGGLPVTSPVGAPVTDQQASGWWPSSRTYWSGNRVTAAALGLTFLVLGIIGFAVSDTFARSTDDTMFGTFEVNQLHNLVHVAVGLILLAASMRHRIARIANIVVAVALIAVGIFGIAALNESWNIFAINKVDNWLHLASAAMLLVIGLFADMPSTASERSGADAYPAERASSRGWARAHSR